jgi:hypothetical protein
MKTSIVVIFFVLIFWGCTSQPTTPTYTYVPSAPVSVVAEGTVVYFEGGGPVEAWRPAGYELTQTKWISGSANSDTGHAIYLSGQIDSSNIGRRVRAFGTLDSVRISFMFNDAVEYVPEIDLDSLSLIN